MDSDQKVDLGQDHLLGIDQEPVGLGQAEEEVLEVAKEVVDIVEDHLAEEGPVDIVEVAADDLVVVVEVTAADLTVKC